MSEHPPVKIPRVARPASRAKVAPFALGLGLVGTAVFASLVTSRAAREEQASSLPPLGATSAPAPLPPPLPAAAGDASTVQLPLARPAAVVLTATPAPLTGPVPVTVLRRTDNGAAERAKARRGAPTLIVDLAQARTGVAEPRAETLVSDNGVVPTVAVPDPTGAAIAAAGSAGGGQVGGDTASRDLNGNERFAVRAGGKETEVARAQRLPNRNTLVTQGTIIGAVMETALNSDLPGFARAIVTRDVLSFDGSAVMIPAGSHVIGEYNSGVAQGASRIFIVWNRLIRPDGVSIALASPAVDDLGRGGLGGKVNRHFFQRFGGAILLSVLTGGISAFTQSRSRGSTVVVSNSSEASSLAGQATRSTDIAPTIKTKQGAAVRIFVARDLDFSAVGAAS